jgi:4-hydroxy-tetrahydrodipicolinate synthase
MHQSTNPHTTFTGIWPALITPFHDGAVDHAALRTLVRRFRDARVSGLVVCATTGEAQVLRREERLAVLDTVIEAAPGLTVMMGLAGIDPGPLLDELDEINRRSVAGILVPPPCYVRPSQAALVRFYADICARTTVPVVVYNIPYRTGVQIEIDTLKTLARDPAIVAVKDCGGDLSATLELIAGGRLGMLAGEDLQIFSTLCLGGAGAIAASAHLRPDLFVKMAELIAAGELPAARRIFYALRPAIALMFAEPSPAPVKAALAALGLIREEIRAPLLPVSSALREQIVAQVRRLEAFEAA